MSAYIVEDRTINRILKKLVGDRDGQWLRRRVAVEFELHLCKPEEAQQFGQKLLDLNYRAVGQRYGDKQTCTDVTFKYDPTEYVPDGQAIRSLQCLNYQCSEGDCFEDKLYKFMEVIELSWLRDFVRRVPEYEAARWE